MTAEPMRLTVVQDCYARNCRNNSDYGVPSNGRTWCNRCLLVASGLMVRIGEDGKCTEFKREPL
jgi:hypothetical protein